jgi:signal transduction histidine kinase
LSPADEQIDARVRLLAASDGELRRIERALHDGVQQDLVAMSVRLQLARRLAVTDLPAALALLAEIENDVREALDSVRALANEAYPSLLEARGLPEALRSAASAANANAAVDAIGVGRYPAQIEASAYFFCRAALAAAGTGATVAIQIREERGELGVVLEWKAGGLDGDALGSARDRIAALGGTVEIGASGDATRIAATLPLV